MPSVATSRWQALDPLALGQGLLEKLLVSEHPACGPRYEPLKFSPLYLCEYILILASNQRLGRPSCLFPSGFRIEILYLFLISRTPATNPIFLDLI